MSLEIITGIHSIVEAIKNPNREFYKLYTTNESANELRKSCSLDGVEVIKKDVGGVQETAQKLYKEYDFNYQRVPSNCFLVSSPTPVYSQNDVYDDIESGKVQKIFILDNITDIHNAAAILRTASFFNVDYLVWKNRGSFTPNPSFARIASGAMEHVKLANIGGLPKFLKKLNSLAVRNIGFSEHATTDYATMKEDIKKVGCVALIVGAEDVGISNATKVALEHIVSFKPLGAIKSLNVSVASALAMDAFFSEDSL